MDAELVRIVRQAAADARRRAMGFPESTSGDDLPWAVTKAFDDTVRGHVERDPGIEDERDAVLIAAVDLAESEPDDGGDLHPMLRRLLDAIDELERVTLNRGVVNRKAAAAGYGTAGRRLVSGKTEPGP